jgi:hypothetical protein
MECSAIIELRLQPAQQQHSNVAKAINPPLAAACWHMFWLVVQWKRLLLVSPSAPKVTAQWHAWLLVSTHVLTGLHQRSHLVLRFALQLTKHA